MEIVWFVQCGLLVFEIIVSPPFTPHLSIIVDLSHRVLFAFHTNQAQLRGGTSGSNSGSGGGGNGGGGGAGEFGHCVVGLSQLFEERERRRAMRAEKQRVKKQQQQEREGGNGEGGGQAEDVAEAAFATAAAAAAAAEEEAALAEEEDRERRGLVKSRFVKPLMFRGLPLLALDPGSGEYEVRRASVFMS